MMRVRPAQSSMEIIRTVGWMKQVASEARSRGRVLGFVPTMGALHEGHLSLIREAQKRCSPVVVSIFINPKQFGPSEDFQKYPRQMEKDRAILEEAGIDYLFAPSIEEMYPKGFRTAVVVEGLSDRLEGRSRPGHFRGVATVVVKLFDIVQPRLSFFGRKDAQQVRILQQMNRDLDLDTEIVVCPIAREADGLAISSRNVYLNANERRSARALYQSLEAARKEIARGERNAARLLALIEGVIRGAADVRLDYAEIVDRETLEPVTSLRKNYYVLLAAFVGGTRLIDNALIEEEGEAFKVTI
jgi:pantoate--beta-alanine ligase